MAANRERMSWAYYTGVDHEAQDEEDGALVRRHVVDLAAVPQTL